ncbi:unnamed protein product, partial [Musa banksii]
GCNPQTFYGGRCRHATLNDHLVLNAAIFITAGSFVGDSDRLRSGDREIPVKVK